MLAKQVDSLMGKEELFEKSPVLKLLAVHSCELYNVIFIRIPVSEYLLAFRNCKDCRGLQQCWSVFVKYTEALSLPDGWDVFGWPCTGPVCTGPVKKMCRRNVCTQPGGVAPFVCWVTLRVTNRKTKSAACLDSVYPFVKLEKNVKEKMRKLLFKCRKPKTKPWLLLFGS